MTTTPLYIATLLQAVALGFAIFSALRASYTATHLRDKSQLLQDEIKDRKKEYDELYKAYSQEVKSRTYNPSCTYNVTLTDQGAAIVSRRIIVNGIAYETVIKPFVSPDSSLNSNLAEGLCNFLNSNGKNI